MTTELEPGQLRRSYDPAMLTFETTADVEPATTIIGQPRGVRAIEFGLAMKSAGFNIYVLGESGTGRTTAIQHFVETKAANDEAARRIGSTSTTLPNRTNRWPSPSRRAMRRQFSDALQTLIHQLRGEIARAFDNQSFRDAVLEVQHVLDAQAG